MSVKIDSEKIKRAARNSVPIVIKSYIMPHETEVYMEEVLAVFLEEFGQANIKDLLAYCMRELAVNAKKANTKRVYFKEQGLNLADAKQYQEGMEGFRVDTMNNLAYYLEQQKAAGLYIKVAFQTRNDIFTMSIRNNSPISKKEQMRVLDRIARSRAFKSMDEAFSTVLDDSEGAGLGIVIIILMLKKIGLNEDNFDLDVVNDETVATITVPFSDLHKENLEALTKEITDQIDILPQFPENILTLQKLINDPDSDMHEIARAISVDPSMTADLLKVVNSAQYVLPRRIDNPVDAVKMVGLKGLHNLILSYGTMKILDADEKAKKLWEHCFKTAFYAYSIARSYNNKREFVDDAYVGGILHDMGKIIFSNAHPVILDKVKLFCKDRGLERNFFEDLSGGLNHAEIGAQLAEKWNFPNKLIDAIRYHHNPGSAPEESQTLVNVVYLANSLSDLQDGQVIYDQLEATVLRSFRIENEDHLMNISDRLQQAFETQRKKRK